MKRGLCIVGVLVLAAQLPLWGYDSSPSRSQRILEAIWAEATGGGTWVTELQITGRSMTASAIRAYFDYGTASRGPITLHAGLSLNCSVRFANILATLQALDPDFTYYGRVGTLTIFAADTEGLIQLQAKTVNGNYGKTFPGLNVVAATTAATGRPMMIQDIVRSDTYRTSVGIYNDTASTIAASFTIYDASGLQVGATFAKTLYALNFQSFNPFTQAGITSGTYENCWLHISVSAGGTGVDGLMCYGSIANNYTNDTYALLAKMYN